MNNIFKFATGELSQDAFICWFFNWFNEGDNPMLKQLVCEFCKDKLDVLSLSSVDIYRQFSKKITKDNTSFSVKIDVLLILNSDTAVIIEDKTFTSEHSNQILRYEEGLKILQDQDDEKKLKIEERAYSISKIMTVYWKTGFLYDCDRSVEADKFINADDLIGVFCNYRGENSIIDMYVQKLLDDKKWYDDHKQYWIDFDNGIEAEKYEKTNLYRFQIAQYTMMREVFPETMWNQKKLYYVYHGSSFGRPWTEMTVYCNQEKNYERAGGWFEIFWRVDADSKGNYISLRLYKMEKGRWDTKYDEFRKCVQDYIEKDGTCLWEDIDPGVTNAYKEADIAHFRINKELWVSKGERIKGVIRGLTEKIMAYAHTMYGENGYEV